MVVATSLWAEQLLDGADVAPILEQMGGERVTEGVRRGALGQVRLGEPPRQRALQTVSCR